jgi:acyl carrier protein
MSSQLAQLVEGLEEIFPEAIEMDITSETKLEELPDWESMAVVNLQALIERLFEVNIPQEIMGDETTIGELVDLVNHPESLQTGV